MTHLRRLLPALAVAATAAITLAATASAGTDGAATTHGMNTRAAGPATTNSNLLYHGGKVETTPAVYIDWWGSSWASGFTKGGYTSAQAQTYVQDFYTNVGGSSWINSTTQYCQGVAVNTINCGTAGTHITNPTGQLKGVWTDTGSSPARRPGSSAIAAEAQRAASHFGYNANATYFVFLPSGSDPSGFGTQWCAWHGETTFNGQPMAYANMPFQPDAGSSCGQNFVNKTSNSFGNGYFDGFSIVGGHEYGEAETDPNTSSSSAEGWLDSGGAENGDKCAWSATSTNISLGGNQFAVQPLWSNANSGCVLSY